MSNNAAFQPQTLPVNLTVGTTSSGAQVSGGNAIAYRFVNSGSNIIYFAVAQGALPTASVATSHMMLPNTVEVFTLPANAFIAAIASATGNTLQISAGEGV